MSAGTHASLILGLCLLALMLFLGVLMIDFQRKLSRLDREALEARGITPGHCARCGQQLPRNWLFWTQRYVCSPACTQLPAITRRRAQNEAEDAKGVEPTKGSHFREMIDDV
ncbi:uncharacterized protein PHACADRAFT_255094 [Phanerochaete carnosa HHB-10118-sp]|uniref:Uncharacterized protein n=1 Tax=Phanerochaete carnosa (strain HHB-10118-sp) TaxID=650164 RepID=K5X3K3_PHACS|nr:uncharacterized protein PHACADRAFT_255094 [Phanerochaete carnosa HHB-10118-sp]EKM57372.1 hypothetical protein PHACADRAFT_255094 [Phanerochaete carnosa HHB-10118-sp]